jgi:hypothetical protein
MNAILSVFSGLRRLPLGEVDWTLRLWVLGLVGLLLLGALIVAIVSHWRKSDGRRGPTADEELAQFRAMYDRGEISKEEFQKLRSVLGGRIRAQLGTLKHPEVESPERRPPAAPGSNDGRPG